MEFPRGNLMQDKRNVRKIMTEKSIQLHSTETSVNLHSTEN